MSSKFVNNFKTVLFLGALTGLILFLGQLIGGTTGLVIALGIAAVSNFVAYFYSDKLALMSMGAHEVGPEHELYQITAGVAQPAGVPMPAGCVPPADAPPTPPPDRQPA